MLCSRTSHFTITVPLSTQVYDRVHVPVNLLQPVGVGGSPAVDKLPIQGGVEIFLDTSCHRNLR